MSRIPFHALGVALALAAASAARAADPDACRALREADAVAIVGGPLGEVFRNDTPASAENGGDHTTVCGWFPKGYDVRSADGPPARGLLLAFHAMRTPEDARNFHEAMSTMPSPGKPVAGVGEAASLQQTTAGGDAVVHVHFLAKNVAAQVTAWKKGGDVAAAATEAAKKSAATLR
jgi:hypothetical protein